MLIGDKITKSIKITFESETGLSYACSLTFKNEHYVIGGEVSFMDRTKKQISKLNGQKLDRIGTLDFQFILGTCTTVESNLVYLCFCSASRICNNDERRLCRFASRPEDFEKTGNYESVRSLYTHTQTSIAASNCECIERP